jgi:hypothetical protein
MTVQEDRICVLHFVLSQVLSKSRDSSVGIALGYGLHDRGVLGFHFRRGLGIFLFTTVSRTAQGPTRPPIQWILEALSPGVKRPGREADHSPPTSARSRMHGAIPPSQYLFMTWCLVKHRDNFTLCVCFLFRFYEYLVCWFNTIHGTSDFLYSQ